jgi:hypothetical protein
VVPALQASLFFPSSLPSALALRLASLFFAFVLEKRSFSFVPGPDPGPGPEASDATKLNFRLGPPIEETSSAPAALDRNPPRRMHARKVNLVEPAFCPTYRIPAGRCVVFVSFG